MGIYVLVLVSLIMAHIVLNLCHDLLGLVVLVALVLVGSFYRKHLIHFVMFFQDWLVYNLMLDLVHQSRLHFDARKGLACDGRLCIKDLEWPPLRVQRKDLNAGFVHAVGMSIGSSRRVDHHSKGTRKTHKCVKFSKRLLECEKLEFYRIKVFILHKLTSLYWIKTINQHI